VDDSRVALALPPTLPSKALHIATLNGLVGCPLPFLEIGMGRALRLFFSEDLPEIGLCVVAHDRAGTKGGQAPIAIREVLASQSLKSEILP
jgi:hypothetical protein